MPVSIAADSQGLLWCPEGGVLHEMNSAAAEQHHLRAVYALSPQKIDIWNLAEAITFCKRWCVSPRVTPCHVHLVGYC